jgi:membrane-associated phospholipid phosphatase
VIAGWIVGFFWASVCWLAAQRFEGAAHIQAEKDKTG